MEHKSVERADPYAFFTADAFGIVNFYTGFKNRYTVRFAYGDTTSASVAHFILYFYHTLSELRFLSIYSKTFSRLK
jgi:hypothetical protein